MIGLAIAIGILLLIILILFLRFRVVFHLEDRDASVYLRVLFLRFPLYPPQTTRKKSSAAKKKKSRATERHKGEHKRAEKKKRVRSLLHEIRLFAWILKRIAHRFPSYFRLDLSQVHITVGGEDAAKTAIRYGCIAQASAYLVTLAEQFFRVRTTRKSDLCVEPDFLSDRIRCRIRLSVSTNIRAMLSLSLRAFFLYWKAKRHEHSLPKKTNQ